MNILKTMDNFEDYLAVTIKFVTAQGNEFTQLIMKLLLRWQNNQQIKKLVKNFLDFMCNIL